MCVYFVQVARTHYVTVLLDVRRHTAAARMDTFEKEL